ncbi:MAG: Hint domain-containing protein [Pseudomonadota bacterium]
MPTLYFSGDHVAFFDGMDANGSKTKFTGVENPFLASDVVEIVIRDSDVGANGEFDPHMVRFEQVTVVRDGVRHDFEVDDGAKIKECGGGSAPEQGDTFFITNDEVEAPSSGPFSGLEDGKLVFSTDATFTTGQTTAIVRSQNLDLNEDGDTQDDAEAKNGTFNAKPALSPPCFVSGTRILTPLGEVPVEALRPGMEVSLAGGERAPVLLTAAFPHRLSGSGDPVRPVVIPPGALGPGRPSRPLRLSPQHALPISDSQLPELQDAAAGQPGAFLRAKALCGCRGISQPPRAGRVTYHALLLPALGALVADGAQALSLWPGPRALRAIGPDHVRWLEQVFPGVSTAPERAYGPPGTQVPRWAVRDALGYLVRAA